MSIRTHTQEEYDAWGHSLKGDTEKWTEVEKCDLDDVSLVARLIYAEEFTREGQASVAQELHNRMRNWRFKDGSQLSYLDSPGYKHTWKGIIYASKQYTPIADSNSRAITPITTDADWKSACDFAFHIVESTLYAAKIVDEAGITNQMRHTGYHGRLQDMQAVLASYNSTTIPWGEDGSGEKMYG